MDKLKELGQVCFGCLAARSFEGQKDFDKYYIDRVIKQVVKKTGEGEEDFIIVDKEIETKRDIRKVINAQASEVGIEAYIRQFEVTGESMPDVEVGEDIQDFTQMPGSLADAILLGESSRKKFLSLPEEIRGKMTYDEFITKFNQDMFDAYCEKLLPKKEDKVPEGKD